MSEKLSNGEIIVRFCPSTHSLVLAEYEGGDYVLCYHNEEKADDLAKVKHWIEEHSDPQKLI